MVSGISDYKSNFLGKNYHDYNLDNLSDKMSNEHYFLQYHIYTVALHRYLLFRIKDYDYDKDFGGVFYFFLRGMSSSNKNSAGIFYDLPPKNLILSLSDTISGL